MSNLSIVTILTNVSANYIVNIRGTITFSYSEAADTLEVSLVRFKWIIFQIEHWNYRMKNLVWQKFIKRSNFRCTNSQQIEVNIYDCWHFRSNAQTDVYYKFYILNLWALLRLRFQNVYLLLENENTRYKRI